MVTFDTHIGERSQSAPSPNGSHARDGGPLRIAQVAPCWLTVPPTAYGGIEAMIALLSDGLTERGHHVTLFASGGSEARGEVATYYDEAPGMATGVENPLTELPHVLAAYERASEFDIIHDHTFPLGPSIGAHIQGAPVVHTVHGPPEHPSIRPIYELLGRRINLVAISEYQRRAVPGLTYAGTVYNGVDVDAHPWRKDKDDYLLFMGRMSPEKGAHLAAEAASRLGRRLLIAGKMKEPAEKEYFESEVRPRMNDQIEMLGETGGTDKLELYANAACLLMPIQWPEPFGLVMVEAMACGTPVVALRNGSVPEIVEDGVTGFVADDFDAFVESVDRAIDSIDPSTCRQVVEERFSTGAMVDGYEDVYRSLLA